MSKEETSLGMGRIRGFEACDGGMTARGDPGGMETKRTVVALAALMALTVPLPACTSGGTVAAGSFLASEDASGASSQGFPAPNQDMVYNAAMAAVRSAGYVPDPNLSSSDAGRVETRWRMKMSPFSGMGTRERVTVRIRKVPKKTNFFTVETNVMAQANDNIADPSNPIGAEWTQGKRNPTVENMINNRIEMMFLKGDVSDEFRRKHNMTEGSGQHFTQPKEPVEPQPGFMGFPPMK